MATSNFEMIGKISMGRESDKFHPFEDKTYDSGWERKTLKFNASCGDNSHLLTVQAGAFADGHGDVYSFTKGSINEDGTKVKGQSVKIPFKDRLTSKLLPEIAEFKKFIIDLEEPGRRYKLNNLATKIKEGSSATDEELKEVGLENESEVAEALEKSNKKRHEYISEWDYVDFIKKVIDSGKYKDRKFLIKGTIDCSYSDVKQTVYKNLIPSRIYLAAEDAVNESTATINFLYGSESVDDMSKDETGKIYVNGWVMSYDNNRKGDIPVPTTVVIPVADDSDENGKKKVDAICRKFKVDDDTIKSLPLVIDMLNGAQKMEISMDDLTDEQKDDIECGLLELDDIIRDMGGSVYGDRVNEYRFNKLGRGASKGAEDTVYTMDDMEIKPLEDKADGEFEDLFEEDDDEL